MRPLGWRWGRLTHSLVRHFTHSIERQFAPNSSDPEFLPFLRLDPLQSRRLPVRWVSALRSWLDTLPTGDLGVGPALIVQGDADLTVDWRYNVRFYGDLFPGSELNCCPGQDTSWQTSRRSCAGSISAGLTSGSRSRGCPWPPG